MFITPVPYLIQVNNAAVSFNPMGENSMDYADTVISTNYYGSKQFTDAMLPLFHRSASMSRILNISSRLGTLDVRTCIFMHNISRLSISIQV
ncbi:putative NAD(P)-binding domain superfamily [Helianthus annuus]|nr:putative NAD(P)-binding domain superfamily [Helianthus annuus]